jgi:hypothetical protein
MIQVLLCGTGPYEGETVTLWVDHGSVGETVRWNGSPWRISAQYGTRFSLGMEARARKSEKSKENPLKRYN